MRRKPARRLPVAFDRRAEAVFLSTSFPPKSHAENVLRGLAAVDVAIADVLNRGAGVVPLAMRRPDVGPITFHWGAPGDPSKKYGGGSGLSHIIAKHGVEVVEPAIETIARGRVLREEGGGINRRVVLEHAGHKVILSLHDFGTRATWLITAYKKRSKDRHSHKPARGPRAALLRTINRNARPGELREVRAPLSLRMTSLHPVVPPWERGAGKY